MKYFIYIFLLSLLLGCSTEEDDDFSAIPIPKDMFGFLFDTGTTWKYKSTTGIEDSVHVYNTKETFRGVGGPGGRFKMICYMMQIVNKIRSEDYTNEISMTNWWAYWDFDLMFSLSVFGDSFQTFHNHRFYQFYKNMDVQNETFKNVWKNRLYHGFDYDSSNYENIYVAEGIGIIRKEIFKSNSWVETRDLISYKINYHLMQHNE